ncbi:Hypothetical predicted protein, partial [Pelobates cultripes]
MFDNTGVFEQRQTMGRQRKERASEGASNRRETGCRSGWNLPPRFPYTGESLPAVFLAGIAVCYAAARQTNH